MKSKRKANRNQANRGSGDGSSKKMKFTEQSDLPPVESSGDIQHKDNDCAEDNAIDAIGTAVENEATTESPALTKADTVNSSKNAEKEGLKSLTDETNTLYSGCESVKTVAGGTHDVEGENIAEGEEKDETKSEQLPSNAAALEQCKPELTTLSFSDAAIEPCKPELITGEKESMDKDLNDVVNKNLAFCIETTDMNTDVAVNSDRDICGVTDTKAHTDEDLFSEEQGRKDEAPMQSEKVLDSESFSAEKECDSASIDMNPDNCVAEEEQPSHDTEVLATSTDLQRPIGQEIGEGSMIKHTQKSSVQELEEETTAVNEDSQNDQMVVEKPTDRDVQGSCSQELQEVSAPAEEQGLSGQNDGEGANITDMVAAVDQVMEEGFSGTDIDETIDQVMEQIGEGTIGTGMEKAVVQEAGETTVTDEEAGETNCTDMEDAVDQEARETTSTHMDEAGETNFAETEAAVDQEAEEKDMAMAVDQEAGEGTNETDIGETIDQVMGLMEEGTSVADDLTDSQLCALDWSCQVPSSEAHVDCNKADPRATDTVKKLAVADNMLLENATAVVVTLIKELQYLNRSLLKTKREVEAARRQRLH